MDVKMNSGMKFGATSSISGKANPTARAVTDYLKKVGGPEVAYVLYPKSTGRGVGNVEVFKGGTKITGLAIHGGKSENPNIVAYMVQRHVKPHGIEYIA